MINNLTTKEFEEKVLQSKKPAMVKLYTKTCVPCKIFNPIFEEMAEENPHIDFFEVDAEEEYGIAGRYDLMSVPTLLYFNKGDYIGRVNGNLSKEAVLSMLEGA